MPKFTQEDRQRWVNQMLASWAIEGFDPDTKYLELLGRYVRGELTIAQVRAQTDAEFGVSAAAAEKIPTKHAA